MSPTRPEAETEYSRAGPTPGGDSGSAGTSSRPRPGRLAAAVAATGTLGAVLLLVAEFTPVLTVHSSARDRVIDTVSSGSNHSYALIPIAVLAAFLSWAAWRTANRLTLAASGGLGVVALLIALLGDLPDAQASGLIGSPASGYALASSSAGTGLYLETLGAVVLLVSAGAGLLLLGIGAPPSPALPIGREGDAPTPISPSSSLPRSAP